MLCLSELINDMYTLEIKYLIKVSLDKYLYEVGIIHKIYDFYKRETILQHYYNFRIERKMKSIVFRHQHL